MWDVLRGVQKLDRARERIPTDRRDNRLLQRVLGCRDLTCQPDSDPSREPWLRYERHGRRHLHRIVWRIDCELRRRIRRHARINEEPSNHHGRYAGPTREHPAILHGCQPATPAQHLRPSTATAAQQSP